MNRLQKTIRHTAPLLVLALLVVGSFVFSSFLQKAKPYNPLLDDAQNSQMSAESDIENDTSETAMGLDSQSEINKSDGVDNQNIESVTQPIIAQPTYPDNSELKAQIDENQQKSENLESNIKSKHYSVIGTNDNGNTVGANEPSDYTDRKTDPLISDSVYFIATIKDGETVYSRDYSFKIKHKKPNLRVKSAVVYVNGARQNQFIGRVLLDKGKNTIRISVRYLDENQKIISVFRDYTVYYYTKQNISETTVPATTPPQQTTAEKLDIYTDLQNKTVHSEQLDFTAYVTGGSELARLTVVVNGNTVSGKNRYTANLKIGSNVIRLKATCEIDGKKETLNRSFSIKYVPLATDRTAPKIRYINVQDGMTVVGSYYTLNVDPVDYNGNRIYYNGITVKLNGTVYLNQWVSSYTSYLLWLEDGANTLDIRLTDSDGRFADYTYTIYCKAVEDGQKIGEITLSVDANVLGLGYLIEPMKVEVRQGETGAEVIAKALESKNFSYINSGSLNDGFYISRICKPGIGVGVNIPSKLVDYINQDGLVWFDQHYDDSIGEFDYCRSSGWMYSINGDFTNFGLTDAKFKDGDEVKIRFTLSQGKDIGGFVTTGSLGGSNYDTQW